MCIRFGHPTKKNELVWGSPWEAAMAGVGASMGAHGELTGEGKEGEGEGGEGGAPRGRSMGRGRAAGGVPWGGWALFPCSCCCYVLSACCAWETGRRKERKKKRKEKKRKKEKNKEIFRKIKDNLWSWSKNIFVQKVIGLIINK
jgi:hypothetical protein